ncbi:MBL fold metallo-hydrolase [Ferrovibrio sp.]|jgi:ribonuclease Z|uniref:MBL fold metallo-hydrolase n=1 Tax=Ferrovibrio sp. TaxID=1917215 RepID=UPI0035B1BCC2
MRVTLLGTGCPQVSTRRYGPSSLLRWKERQFLVDCGSGVTQRLLGAGSAGKNIDALFLTHLHSDHIVDLFQLIISSWHQGRDRPQRIFGPPGTRQYLNGLMALWRSELEQRIAHEKRPSTRALELDITEVEPGIVLRDGDLTVIAVAVRHQPVKAAYGYVFTDGSQKVAFSGDTAFCPELILAAKDADALVHECFIHREMLALPGVRRPETIENVASYHTLSTEVGKVAAQARARCLILNHFVPVAFDAAALMAEVRADYAGPVLVGEDLMQFDTATRMVSHGDVMVALPPS